MGNAGFSDLRSFLTIWIPFGTRFDHGRTEEPHPSVRIPRSRGDSDSGRRYRSGENDDNAALWSSPRFSSRLRWKSPFLALFRHANSVDEGRLSGVKRK